MNVTKTCGNCGNPLQSNDPAGICPSCLMGHAFPDNANNPTLDASGYAYPRAEELVGQFPNLEILHLLGQGGMGAVYLARQTKLDRIVALKVLSPKLGSDPSFAERFNREARALAKLSHPNIVTVFDYGKTNNLNYLLMEYIDGVNLRDAIQTGKLTPEEALAIVPQICDALQYAHNQGVIHRDIKPENILLDNLGRVKIADFGLAKLLETQPGDFTLTGTHQVLGTRNYMAPEQIEKPDVVDHRADIYSLGVVFYELLTGELPIGRFSVPSEKAAVSHQLDDIVLRTLEKDPGRRFQQASEIRSAVDSLGGQYAPQSPPLDPTPPRNSIATLPFAISELYAGFATAHGIAHLFSDRIELEYQIVDDLLGTVKSDAKTISIPIGNLISVRLKTGIFSDRVECQTDRIEFAKDIPNAKQGRFLLGTKRGDVELAKQFVGQVDRIRRQTKGFSDPTAGFQPPPSHPQGVRQPAPPQKSNVDGQENQTVLDHQHVVESLKIPYYAFLIVGVLHLLTAVKGFLRAGAWQEFNWPDLRIIPSVDVSLFLPRIDFGSFQNFTALLIGVLLISIASRLRRPRDYKFVFVALIAVMIVPVHFAHVAIMVFAIWSLVLLCDDKTKRIYEIADGVPAENIGRKSVGFSAIAIGMMLALACVAFLVVAASVWFAAQSHSIRNITDQRDKIEMQLTETDTDSDSDSDSEDDESPDSIIKEVPESANTVSGQAPQEKTEDDSN